MYFKKFYRPASISLEDVVTFSRRLVIIAFYHAFLPHDATQSAILPWHVVCPSVMSVTLM